MYRAGLAAVLFGLVAAFGPSPVLAQDASGSSDSGSSEVPIGGTEKFSNPQTQQLEAQIADDEAHYGELDSEIKDLKSDPMENHDQIDDLESQQRQTYREWGRLEEELDRAKLEAIQDAQEGNSTEEQLKAEKDKRDALEALKGWSAQYVGILEQPHIDIQDQLKAEEDSVKNLENKAAAEKQKQGDSGSGSSGSGSSGSGSSGSGSSGSGSSGSGVPSSDEGGGGISLVPLVLGLLLLGGVVYGVVAGGSGLAGRVRGLVGTPLAGGRAPRGGATGASTGAAPSPSPPSDGSGSFADPGPGSGPEPRTDSGGGDPPGGSPGPGAGGGAGGGGAPEGSAGPSGGEDPDE